jgi:hypothetical protein
MLDPDPDSMNPDSKHCPNLIITDPQNWFFRRRLERRMGWRKGRRRRWRRWTRTSGRSTRMNQFQSQENLHIFLFSWQRQPHAQNLYRYLSLNSHQWIREMGIFYDIFFCLQKKISTLYVIPFISFKGF